MSGAQIAALVVGLVILLGLLGVALFLYLKEEFRARHERKVAAIEAELDQKAEELRDTVFRIASALHQEGHATRKDMIREAYIQSGRVPE